MALPSSMNTIHTTLYSKIIPSATDLNFWCYQYTAYIMEYTHQLTPFLEEKTVVDNNRNSIVRLNYDVNTIQAGDTIYFDFTVKLNNKYTLIDLDFNDTYVKYNLIQIDSTTVRIFGLYTVTEYDVSGTASGRVADYNNGRWFDIGIWDNTEPSIVESYIFKNPTIHNGTFVDFLEIPNPNAAATFYNISAIDLAGNVSKSTYALIYR